MFVQYYDPFFREWYVVRERGVRAQVAGLYQLLEDAGMRMHCSIYEVNA